MADEQKKYLSEDDMGFGAATKAPSPKYLSESDMGFANGDEGGFVASAKQSVGSLIKGAGQAAADFIPGVGQDNAVKQYGQSVIDANPTAVKSLGDIADKPGMAVREAAGNATGSIGGMVGARVLGNAITAAAPLTGPLAPATAAVGQGVAWLGPWAAAALPSFGGIREQQIKDDPTRQDSVGSKALAAAGAGTVGVIENKFGPQEWALKALTKEGRTKLAEKFAANSVAGSIGKGAARGAAVEGAEELAQNPVEQLAAYQDPTTAENVQDTLFGGAMGFLGGGVFGGGVGAASRAMGGENGKAAPPADPADTQDAPPRALPAPTYTGTPNDQMLQAEAERSNAVAEAEARAAGIYQQRADFEAAQQGQAGAAAGESAPTDLRQTIEDTTGISGRAAPGGSRLKDLKAAFDEQIEPQVIIDDSGKVTTTTNKLEFQQFQADYENRVALRQRNIEAGRRLRAAKAGINPDDGPLSAGAAIALESAASGQEDQSLAAESKAPTPTPGPQAAPTGSFGAMNDFAELLNQEQQDAAQRRTNIAEVQGQRREFEMAEADRRTEESMQREAQGRRQAVLDAALADPETKNSAGRFAATLRREGYRDSTPTADELKTIQRFEDVRAAQPAPPEIEPSAPNEMDAAAMGIRERRPKVKQEAPSIAKTTKPSAVPSPNPGDTWAGMDASQRADVVGRLQGVPPIVSKNVPRVEWGKINPALQGKLAEAMGPRAASPIEGADLGDGWAAFRPESGTAGVPRAEMPQIKAEHRGAMVNFMNARGVQHREGTVPAASLKPTQAEFSREKVARAKAFDGGSRSILVSADNHVLDGHHQWMAARDKGEDVKVIRLNAPIRDLVGLAHDFPSSTTAGGAATAEGGQGGQNPERGGAPAEPAGAAGGGRDAVGQALQILMDRTDGIGAPDGLSGPEHADARTAIVSALTGESVADIEAAPNFKFRTSVPQMERLLYDAAGIPAGKTLGDRRTPFMDWLDQRESGGALASTELSSRADALDQEMARKLQEAEGSDVAPAAVNQEPIKNETRASAGPAAEISTSDQAPVKKPAADSPAVGNAPSPLEALFSDLNSDSTRKANKARKMAAKLPEAARIEYVQANFHDILMQMMEAGALEVNGFATLTEDNAPCL